MKPCPACGHEGAPRVEFTPTGLVEKCPQSECNSAWGVIEPHAAPIPNKPQTATGRPAKARPESFDVIKAAKARLREVKRQLTAMRALEKERDQLTRLLTAAERPLAEVKRLRANS